MTFPSSRDFHFPRITADELLRLLPAFIAVGLMYSSMLWDWDRILYDLGQRLGTRAPLAEIVIIEIDQQSIDAIGRWPWARNVHAELLEKLTDNTVDGTGARAIGFDIVFAEKSVAVADNRLIDSVRTSGRVVLPVVNEQQRYGGQLREILPISGLTESAAALGHVDRPIDADSVSRSVYLKAGLGDAHWPSFGLAMTQLAYPKLLTELPGIRRMPDQAESPHEWRRDYNLWLSYAGPPGHFSRLSYIDVLNNKVADDQFRDKLVLIGATAAGLGDQLSTPVSGGSTPMAGVEIIANEIDTLINGFGIVSVSRHMGLLITALLVLVSMQLLSRLPPQWSIVITVGGVIVTVVLAAVSLYVMHRWFAPMATVVGIVGGYILWSWVRLIHTIQHLNRSLDSLESVRSVINSQTAPKLDAVMPFVAAMLPVESAQLQDGVGRMIASWSISSKEGHEDGKFEWCQFGTTNKKFRVGWFGEKPPNPTENSLLSTLAQQFSPPELAKYHTPVEILERRIQKVEYASERLQKMRQFITEILTQMGDGIIVSDNLGRILQANQVANIMLGKNSDAAIGGLLLQTYWNKLRFNTPETSLEVLRTAVIDREPSEAEVRGPGDRDLLIKIVPFHYGPAEDGIIIDIVDISLLRDNERRRREVLSFLSHDLRSPLASIMALAQLAEMEPDRLIDGDYVDRIAINADKALGLADDFLNLLRVEDVKIEEFRSVDLVATAMRSGSTLLDQAERKNISLSYDCDQSEYVHGDAGLLERMFTNLLSNAIKYSPSGSRVTVGIAKNNRDIKSWVHDTGYGIAPESIPNLFNRFERIHRKEHKQESGSGLGLMFVNSVVALHKGTIQVESKMNEGSKFTVTLPSSYSDDI